MTHGEKIKGEFEKTTEHIKVRKQNQESNTQHHNSLPQTYTNRKNRIDIITKYKKNTYLKTTHVLDQPCLNIGKVTPWTTLTQYVGIFIYPSIIIDYINLCLQYLIHESVLLD